MTDARDIAIRVQSTAHDTAQLLAAITQPGTPLDQVVTDFQALHSVLYTHVHNFIAGEVEELAVSNVVTAFPGSTVEQAGPFDTAHELAQQTMPGMPPVPGQSQQGGYAQPYAPPAPPVGYQPPMVPQGPQTQAQQYPPPPVPQQPSAPGMGCPKCGGATYDNRTDNQRRRMNGNKLGAEFKCKNRDCGGVVWPADFQAYAQCPPEPRR